MSNRHLSNNALKAKILLAQDGRCGYCNSSLWNEEIQWDHFLPWSYIANSGGENNWVAACSICNRRKHSKVFKNEKDIAVFCTKMIISHGSFGEGFEKGANSWRLKLEEEAQKTPTRQSR